MLADGTDDDKALARERLTWWKDDPKFAPVREANCLDALPAEEQAKWRAMWAGVDEALAVLR